MSPSASCITIADLQHPDQPAVIRALEVKCGMCGEPAGHYCHAVGIGKRMASLVHYERATRDYDRKKA